jgi:WD40 repeat protein
MNRAPHLNVPRLRIFISSPSDVLPERGIADRVIARLDGLWQTHVRLTSERWERRYYEAASSFQASIGAMADYEVVIGILWKRIGSPLPPDLFLREDGTPYESGTAFELESALAASEKGGKPAVYLFRKSAPVAFSAVSVEDEQRQYNGLLRWWERTTSDAGGHFRRGYQTYSTFDEFEDSLTNLIEEHLRKLELIPSGTAWDIKTEGSPYPGLLPYDSSYSSVFFGRSLAVAGALAEIKEAAGRDAPALFIVGPSGSGKSSLALAGLVPNLTHGPIAGVDFWRALLLEPAADPILALAQRLYDALPDLATSPQATPESFAALARGSVDSAAQVAKWGLERAAIALQGQVGGGRVPVGRLLIYVDQLETILGTAGQHVFAGLVRALVAGESAWFVTTLRSDRYADLQLDPDFLELRRRSALFDLPPPGPSEIADIIVGPAHAAGLIFEERDQISLAKVIRSEVTGADALPLLQMTLASLCEARQGSILTYAAYEQAGGLEGAIAAHAEMVFATVSPTGQAMLDPLLQALVADIDDAGRLTLRTPEIAAIGEGAMRELVTKMIEARLLVNAAGSVRVGHEALLRRWQRAATSPALQPEVIRLRRQITPNLDLWSKTRLDADLLQPGTALAAAESILRKHPGSLSKDLESYVEHSARSAAAHASAETRKARHRTYAATGVAIVLAAFAFMVFRLYQDASNNFVLALLTRANAFLIAEEPTRALVLANSLGQSSLLERPLAAIGLSTAGSDQAVRIRTIAQVTGPAGSAPRRTLVRSTPANAAAFSQDGSKFAIGYADGKIVVFSSERDGKEQDLLGQSGRVWSVRFSPDGQQLATATSNDVVLWDLRDGSGKSLCVGNHQIIDLAYDPKGQYLAWSTKDGQVAVWDLHTAQLRSFEAFHNWALAIDFSADGTLVAASGEDGTVAILRTSDLSVFKILHTGRVDLVGLSFRPDGHVIATASLAGPVDVWGLQGEEAETHTPVAAPPNKRWKVRFSPDNQWLAIASWDGTVRLWDARSFRYRGTIDGNDQRVNDIAFATKFGGLLTANESGAVRLWELSRIEPMFDDILADSREALVGQYSRDGTKFAAGGKDGTMTVYQVDAGGRFSRLCTVQHRNWVTSVAFSPDSKRVASVGMADTGDEDDGIRISEISAGETCGPLGSPINVKGGIIRALAYQPGGNTIAWSNRAGEIWLADLDGELKPIQLPQLHTAGVEEIDFSASGKFLASAGRDGRVVVWNVASHRVERVLREAGPSLFTVKFAPDDKLIAAGGAQDTIQVWDTSRPKGSELVKTLPVIGGSNRLAFKQDGSLLAVGSDGRYISMWSVGSWDKVFQLDALVGVRSVYGFHPTRGDLAFDGEDGLVRVLHRQAPVPGAAVSGILSGMDVFFDRLASNVSNDRTGTIESGFESCVAR